MTDGTGDLSIRTLDEIRAERAPLRTDLQAATRRVIDAAKAIERAAQYGIPADLARAEYEQARAELARTEGRAA